MLCHVEVLFGVTYSTNIAKEGQGHFCVVWNKLFFNQTWHSVFIFSKILTDLKEFYWMSNDAKDKLVDDVSNSIAFIDYM